MFSKCRLIPPFLITMTFYWIVVDRWHRLTCAYGKGYRFSRFRKKGTDMDMHRELYIVVMTYQYFTWRYTYVTSIFWCHIVNSNSYNYIFDTGLCKVILNQCKYNFTRKLGLFYMMGRWIWRPLTLYVISVYIFGYSKCHFWFTQWWLIKKNVFDIFKHFVILVLPSFSLLNLNKLIRSLVIIVCI
jgi:hypothetical protein